jgi:hypothetical protein
VPRKPTPPLDNGNPVHFKPGAKVVDHTGKHIPQYTSKLIVPKTNMEKLITYAGLLVDGVTPLEAYYQADPSRTRNHLSADTARSYYNLHKDFLQQYIFDHIGTKAPIALQVITQIMLDEGEKGGIRLKAAQDLLDRAGFNSKTKLEITTKDVKDLTTDDLTREIQKIMGESPELAKVFQFPKSESK